MGVSAVPAPLNQVQALPAPRTVDQVLAAIMAYQLPTGWAWNGDPTSRMGKFYQALADCISSFEVSALAQLQEVDQRTAVELLPDYERVLGPDPAGRDLVVQTLSEQQTVAYQRWTSGGGQSIAFYVAMGAAAGVPVTIDDDLYLFVAGAAVATDVVAAISELFVWTVTMPAANPQSVGMEALIARAAPAHTTPVFYLV